MAADGHEPACNPYAASSAWSINHRNSYASGASPFPAPHVGDQVGYQAIDLGTDSPIIIQFSEPYADGRRAVWFTIIGVPESRTVYKLDYDTGDVLAKASISDEGGLPGAPSTSGVYNLLDRDNHLIAVRDRGLAVYADAQPGVRTSDIELRGTYELPPRALCRADDRIIGLTLTYAGEVVFATVQGMLGVFRRQRPASPRRHPDAPRNRGPRN